MIKQTTLLALGGLLLMAAGVQANRTITLSEPIVVRLEVGQLTALVLPEAIAGLGVYTDPERMFLDYDGPYILLQAIQPNAAGRFFPVGVSGKLYRVSFRVATPADDVVYVVQDKATLPGIPGRAAARVGPLTPGSMLRALRQGMALPDQAAIDVPAPVLNDERLVLSGWQAISAGGLVGVALSITNATDQELGIDLRYGMGGTERPANGVRVSLWAMPPTYTLRAITADAEHIGPQGAVRVYLVLEKR